MQPFNKIFLIVSVIFAFINLSNKEATEDVDIHQLWLDCKAEKVVSFDVFNIAVMGYRQIDNIKNKNIITIIDYSKPSTEKRFFVIDLKNKILLSKYMTKISNILIVNMLYKYC
jgi:L,D-transpeptidase catalytic domain